MKNVNLARLVVKLEAEVAKYHKEMQSANRSTRKFQKGVSQDLKRVKQAFAGFLAFVSAKQVASFYKANADGIDLLAKRADKLGILTDKLQAIRHLGELSGVSVENIDKSLEKMNRSVSEAAEGTGEAVSALAELNLNADVLNNLPVEQKLGYIADAMREVESRGDQTRLAMDIFGRQGGDLLNLLDQGSAGIAAAAAELDRFGVSIDRIDAAKVELANDQLTRVSAIAGKVGQRFATETAPIVGALADKFLQAAEEGGGLGNMSQKVVGVISRGFGFAADSVHGLKIIFFGLRQVVAEVASRILSIPAAAASLGGTIAEKLGFDASGLREVQAFSESFKQSAIAMRQELNEIAMQPLPSERVKAWVDDVYLKAESAARAKAAESGDLSGLLFSNEQSADGVSDVDPVDKKASELSALERLQRNHKNRILQDEAEVQFKRLQFQEATTKGKIKMLLAENSASLGIVAGGSKKIAKIMRKISMFNALRNTYEGISAGVRLGWPLGIPAVAWATLTGFQSYNAIKNESVDGGGSAGSFTSSFGSVPSISSDSGSIDSDLIDSASTSTSATNIYIQGDIYETDDFKQVVVDAVAEASNNNSLVIRDQSGRTILETA